MEVDNTLDIVLSECLQFFIENKKRQYSLVEIKTPNTDARQIKNTLSDIPSLFAVTGFSIHTLIKISINIRACTKYNTFIHCDENRCSLMHICDQKLTRPRCRKRECKLNHNIDNPRNRNILSNMNIKTQGNLLLKFLQVFRDSETDTVSENSINTNLNKAHNQFSTNSFKKIEIKIQLPKKFIDSSNETKFKQIFSDVSIGGPIEKCKYIPRWHKAFIIFKDDSIAEKLINQKNVKYQGFHFVVTKAQQKRDNQESNESEDQDDKEFEQIDFVSSDKTSHFYIKNVPIEKKKFDVLRYAAFIVASSPKSASLINPDLGTWLIEFNQELDIADLLSKFENLRVNLPPGIRIDTVYNEPQCTNNNEINFIPKRKNSKVNEPEEKYVLEKRMENNIFLQLILKDRNTAWKNDLKENIDRFKANFNYDTVAFKIISLINPGKDIIAWRREADDVLKNFFREFSTKSFTYDKTHLEFIFDLKKCIEETRQLYLIDYFDDPKDSKLSVMAKKPQMKAFLEKYPQINQIIDNQPKENFRGRNKNTKSGSLASLNENSNFLKKFEKDPTVTKDLQIPQITYMTHEALINQALKMIKTKYELEDYYVASNLLIKITGTNQNVNKSYDLIKRMLNNIQTKRVDGTNLRIFKCKNLKDITKDLLEQNNFLFTVEVKPVDLSELPGFYVTYFYNVPDLEFSLDSAFEQASKFLKENIVYHEIDITSYSHLLITEKWKTFEKAKFRKEVMAKNFSFSITPSLNNQNLIVLCGKKDHVEIAKFTVEEFFAGNETKAKKIPVKYHEAKFLVQTGGEEIKKLESKFDIKIEINPCYNAQNDSSYILVKNYPDNLYLTIEKEITNLINSKKTNLFTTDYLPGLDKLLNKVNNAFCHSIEKIQNETSTIILTNFSVQTNTFQKPSDSPITPKPSKSRIFQDQFYTSQTKNKISRRLKIANSAINLEIGSITETQADVIVNTTNTSLSLSSGILSNSILQVAGNAIENECRTNYPNGIKRNSIAITTAGNMQGVSYLFHAAFSHLKDLTSAQNDIETVIFSSFAELDARNLNKISFPALGTGGFRYPASLVAPITLLTISKFLQEQALTGKKYNVNIVIYEKDDIIIKEFEKEFDSFDNNYQAEIKKEPVKQQLKDLNQRINLFNSKAQGKFTIYYKSSFEYKNATDAINKLINEEYLAKDVLNESNMEHITTLSQDDIYRLVEKYPDIEVIYENKSLTLVGLKSEVLSAKVELSQIINKLVANQYSKMVEQVKISKDIQWQFEIQANSWRNFSVFLNSLIESSHLKKESKVTFENEDNEIGSIYFNVNPFIYIIGRKQIKVRRLDTTKLNNESIQFPSHWSITNSNHDLDLVDLVGNSTELQAVVNDFKAKLQNASVQVIKVQRVQNQLLYKQFSIHREKFTKEKRNINEKDLFHGSTEDSLLKICRFGFNRSYCGKNGVAYGHGVYFALNSSYSRSYSQANHQGYSCMIRAKVTVGESCVGNSTMKTPPERSGLKIPYDSTTDQSQSIFVCYHDNQCYPEYLIYFR
ncbi:unnamed protein product [Brachionus calyciflorus]|uniref:Poly [ADP-ribose] polymerase n=1 Tax=Brachionus calyciflorus TaxID=104777 RepID=A0A813T012_9BILA|nr:unnamed protein product [Brachionus calyciflorus]